MTTLAELKKYFALGDGTTALLPGQAAYYHVPKNKKVVITDIYLQEDGVGDVSVLLEEQTGANTYAVRYRFFVRANETLTSTFQPGCASGTKGRCTTRYGWRTNNPLPAAGKSAGMSCISSPAGSSADPIIGIATAARRSPAWYLGERSRGPMAGSRRARLRDPRPTLESEPPLGDAVETFVRREAAQQFIEEVRGDDPELASYLRIEERELEAGVGSQ